MELEWDENKRKTNQAKHGIDFNDLHDFDWDQALIRPEEIVDGERRHSEIGVLGDRLVVVVYTERGERLRIISARRATRKERQLYAEGA